MPFVLLGSFMGCASHVQKLYDGPERPASEVVTVHDSRRAFVTTIVSLISADDQRVDPTSTARALPAGAHGIQVWVERLSPVSLVLLHDVYTTEAVCGFHLDAPAGAIIRLVDVDAGPAGPGREREMYKASLTLRRETPGSDPELVSIPAECASPDLFGTGPFEIPHDLAKGGLLCRTSADCTSSEKVCMVGDDFEFGTCRAEPAQAVRP